MQMGSHMKKAIFEEQTAKALMKWRRAAKERKKFVQGKAGSADTRTGLISSETTPSRGSSPLHLLHKHVKTNVNAHDIESVPTSPRSYISDTDFSDTDSSSPPHAAFTRDFSFGKP
ncbi:hypothetical protein ACLOJK_038548 [Asimina triloba]